ncbi:MULTISPECIES: rhomboid family intramembrane serine protease [Luteimonas]|uniref:rhomboid family intramembrane serine protease n=1 Tax=Luteimonas TaxID=83614 RepID=UPI000C7C8215|nr:MULTISPECIES: rhomboid family intramembrane serine protease [Luteimonas]
MFPNLPPVVKALLVMNAIVFVLQLALNNAPFYPFMLWPLGGGDAGGLSFMPWQLVTYGFLHGSLTHLFFNMLALFMFGAQLEHTWGPKRFLTYYGVCVVGAGLCQLGVVTWSLAQGAFPYPTLGASGGVFGLLLAYGMLFPNQRIMLLFPPIPMRARTFVIVYGLVELVLGITGTRSGVAHFAHLGGMLFGWLLIQHWRGRPPFNRRRRGHVRRL